MLDQDTKRKIDNARGILVGKVPDPKSQVEQITIALIYKFMDDMDKKSEEWGGKPTFFTGEYEKYAWSKIFDPKLGGFDLIALYGDAIVKMNQNPNIPQLFRDIFKNAYLPYRDPETLKSFLKEINEFTYDHSEQLGDAFEYLLSVMDSQGDAGQFRTPRHIIDFIVEIVDPKKNETVLDPACGTAGFLISSYRHILKSNTKKRNGDQLTPDERKRLLNNFMGYDISPDMVRLSLVNLYLHGFSDPKIVEYDTLSSEERWNETADVMLANPPFMTPKGGIQPHKRFSIQAKRSEVLFVDYIAEHLNPYGRAGVIVPEGIIFQSAKAYKNLRKMLVENYLWAVVSLPAGVFNPYANVKTSILLMDKTLAKKTDKILFVKIENDGFDLGAQRRPIDKNDLPKTLEFIKDYKKAVMDGREVKEVDFALVVGKDKVAESGDWSLSRERYRDFFELRTADHELFELSDVAEVFNGKTFPRKEYSNTGNLKVIKVKDYDEYGVYFDKDEKGWVNTDYETDKFLKKGDTLIINAAHSATHVGKKIGYCKIEPPVKSLTSGEIMTVRAKDNSLPLYLNSIVKSDYFKDKIRELVKGIHLYPKDVKKIIIPLPTLDVQESIVAEIDGYQKIIDGARQVVDNYKPVIKIDPDWEMVKMQDACQIKPPKSEVKDFDKGMEVSFVPMADLNEKQIHFEVKEKRKLGDVIKGYTYFRDDDVLLAKITPCFENGKSGIAKYLMNGIGFGSTEFFVFRANKKILPQWIYYFISNFQFLGIGKNNMTGSAGQQRVAIDFMKNYQIPLPPLSVQKEIVAQIETEQEMVNASKKLIEVFEQKIKDKSSEVWGE